MQLNADLSSWTYLLCGESFVSPLFKKICIYLFGCALVVALRSLIVCVCVCVVFGMFSCSMWDLFFFFLVTVYSILSYGIWDLVPWSEIEPRPPALGFQSLHHWTNREVPVSILVQLENIFFFIIHRLLYIYIPLILIISPGLSIIASYKSII